jgi:osmoprotectant transport system permease protein
MHRTEYPSREAILSGIGDWLQREHGVKLLGPLGFENAYALAMRRDKAAALGIRTIEDLARQSANLSIAGDPEFFLRPEWRALQRDYRLAFRGNRTLQATFMYRAVADGEVDVISAYSSDGEIAQYDLVTLEDPKHSLPPYDAVLLIAPKRANDMALAEAFRPLIGAITIERMRKANLLLESGAGQTSPQGAARSLWNDIAAGQ